jgi:MFS family permease
MRLNVGVFVLHMAMMALFLVLPARLTELGLAPAEHWMVYLPVMAAAFVLMVPALIVAEKKSWQALILRLAIALLAGVLLLASVLPFSLVSVLAVLLLFFTAFNYLEASLPALLSRSVYAGGKGTAMGVFASFQFMGAFCGGALGGWVLGHWGEAAVFLAAGLAGLLWLACTVGMVLPVQNISVTLSWPQGGWGYERLRNEVLCLPGTLDVTVFEDERQAYLRVSKGFDLAQLPAELYRRD